MLKTRVITAFAMIAVLACLLFLAPRLVWIIACALCAAVAAFEWANLTRLSRMLCRMFVLVNILLVAGWPLLEVPLKYANVLYLSAAAFWTILVPYWLWRHAVPANTCFAFVAGILVIGSASIALISLRDASSILLLFIMGAIWVSDSMAYFVGSALGRHKLAPNISPGKTWEGVAGALLFVVIYAILWGLFSTNVLPPKYTGSVTGCLALSAVMSLMAVLGIYGDLFESFLKRAVGVKDSGNFLPGHGGALDRIDALLPVLPCAAWLFAN